MPGEHLDLSSEPPRRSEDASSPPNDTAGRPFVGVRFDCCGVYQRVYINREGTAYEGRCPKCMRSVRLLIGPDGTDARFFVAR